MAIDSTKFLSAMYYKVLRDKMLTIINLVGGPMRIINLTFDARINGAYTRVEGRKKDRLRIVIGGQIVKELVGLPERFDNREQVKPYIENIFKAFKALINHELGHDVFTDMKSDEIITYKERKYIPFMHTMFNTMEDPVIEYFMTMYYKKAMPYEVNPKVYFDWLVETCFMPQAKTYKDDGTQAGFMQYILLMLRCKEENIKNRCIIFDKYREDLLPLMRKFLHEIDGTKRIHHCVVLCEWIIENIKEFNWEFPEPEEKLSGKASGSVVGGVGGSGIPMPEKGAGGFGGKSGLDSSDGSTGSKEAKDDEVAGDTHGDSDGGKEAKDDETSETSEDATTSSDEDVVEKDVDDEVYDSVFNDDLNDGDNHEWSIAKEDFEVKDGVLNAMIDEVIEKNMGTIRSVSDFLTLFKGRIRPKDTEGFTSGRLAIRRAMRAEASGGGDTRLFKKKVPRGKDADLVVSLLNDLSGSMGSTKSEICARACIILAQACAWSGIPFEINAFVKTYDGPSGISYTIVEKSFDDDFEQAKPFLGINSRSMLSHFNQLNPEVPTFAGNSEEVNIYYIWKNFRKVKHKTKLMFVLCDGGTTGSSANLRDIVTKMEQEDGIIVIGVGILDKDVLGIYNHAKVFATQADLEAGLAPYLIDTLNKYAK